MKASDNPAPSILLVEQGSTPANPASGNQRLYLESTGHTAKLVNSSGTVVSLGGAGAWTHLAETIVTGSVAASIVLSSISGSYRHLHLRVAGGTDTVAPELGLLQLNADTGANYNSVRNDNTGTAFDGAAAAAATSIALGYIADPSTNIATSIGLWINDYARTQWWKTVDWQGSGSYTNTAVGTRIKVGAGIWRNTAAVTSLTLSLATGNWAIGTVATLYGVL